MAEDKPPEKRSSSGSKSSSRSGRPRLYLVPGQLVGGNYEIAEQIGEGGMAIVYKALQKSLNRYIAIKALHPRYAMDASFVQRFEAESGALAALSHPNIVTIFDRGVEGEVYYFVMEHVDGEDLDKKIIQNTIRRVNDWRTVIQACSDSLTFVHKRGLVHRDIKPSNILCSAEGVIKLGDFGIAHIVRGDKAVMPDEDTSSSSTGNRKPVGTAYYMAPEQITNPGSVDHRADIYSLAVAFYKMMTRRLPTGGEFPAPSEANTDIPTAVDAVIFQALAPNPEDRYQTVKEFCDDLLGGLKDKSASITSLFNYRTPSGASSLYTGDDFKKTHSATGGEDKKTPGTSSGKTGTSAVGRKTSTSSASVAPPPKTPAPAPAKPKKQPRPAKESAPEASPSEARKTTSVVADQPAKKGKTLVILVTAVVLLIVVGAIVGAIFLTGDERGATGRPPAVDAQGASTNGSITGAVSPALERAERERREREMRENAIITGQPTPTATPIPTEEPILTEEPIPTEPENP